MMNNSFPAILSFLLIGVLTTSCLSEQNGNEDAGGAPNQEACAELAQSQCEESQICQPFWAYEYEDGTFESKPDSKTYMGCRDAGRDEDLCGDALTCAYETEGACWMFSSTCLPEGGPISIVQRRVPKQLTEQQAHGGGCWAGSMLARLWA